MSAAQNERAWALYKLGQVKLVQRADKVTYFQVGKYSIYYDGVKDTWSCTCAFGSIWSKQQKDCAHIIACKIYLEEEKRTGGIKHG